MTNAMACGDDHTVAGYLSSTVLWMAKDSGSWKVLSSACGLTGLAVCLMRSVARRTYVIVLVVIVTHIDQRNMVVV